MPHMFVGGDQMYVPDLDDVHNSYDQLKAVEGAMEYDLEVYNPIGELGDPRPRPLHEIGDVVPLPINPGPNAGKPTGQEVFQGHKDTKVPKLPTADAYSKRVRERLNVDINF